ncbi:1-acyl-sn-glycerol-3-phosphate acyltransferase [Limnobacter humi]|uniref:1-acyl-sn-glycerol-3-phosphate acyltransferase n=1 Tax=Limnobacter humi TaxID=1778671 RepID=A0ABT1WC51_9BURK|nr:lysophospholipid acyltransferase family protein [Limnobacter humi]MCQ8895090.1 1-acyl-sn-glycerol-3-phosphate acyltransferase [Limnobacter humi]
MALVRLLRLLAHMLLGFILIMTCWPMMSDSRKARVEHWFASRLMRILRVKVQAHFEAAESDYRHHGPMLIYSNHVSWIDIFAFNAVAPLTFIAKSEISDWPIAGTLAARSGTLFIERGKRHAVRDVIAAAVKVLKAGRTVAVFPEGTTGSGDEPLPFHSNFVQPAIQAGVPLLPVTLQYFTPDGRFTPEPAFVGEQTLVQNLWVLANAPAGFVCSLTFHSPLRTEGQTRHVLSDAARNVIAAACAQSQGMVGTAGSTAST